MEKVKILVYEHYIQCFSGSELGTRRFAEVYQESFVTALLNLDNLLPKDEDEKQAEDDLKKVVENLKNMPPDYYTDPWGYTKPKVEKWSIRLYLISGYKNELGELLIKSSDAQVD
ncbi:MAG: hypothetical protein KBB88_00635 [Candidatus Pacebacteria bacterium]|nr:hypothetical protein [Candidatus Paceibacterota bacterium]